MKITSAVYITGIHFEYFRTYSFQRTGTQQTIGQEEPGTNQIRQSNLPGNPNPYTQRISGQGGNLNPTAVMIREIQKSDQACSSLIRYLKTEIEEELLFLCAPVYRDAILFYNAGHELVAGINICFECDRIESIYGAHISTDFKTFKYLKQLLLQLGHPIESPDEFNADSILALIDKNKAKK